MLGRGRVALIDGDRCAGEGRLGIADLGILVLLVDLGQDQGLGAGVAEAGGGRLFGIIDAHHVRRLAGGLRRLGDHHADDLAGVPDAVRLQGSGVLPTLAARRGQLVRLAADVLEGEDVEHARDGLGVFQMEALDVAPGDGAGDQEGVGGIGDGLVERVTRRARHLGAAVDARRRLAEHRLSEPKSGVVRHGQSSIDLACSSARTRVRRPSSGL